MANDLNSSPRFLMSAVGPVAEPEWWSRLRHHFDNRLQALDPAWLLGSVIALGVVLIVLMLARWLRRQPEGPPRTNLEENLAALPAPPVLKASAPQLYLHGLRVRIRFVVAAPLGTEGGPFYLDDIPRVIDGAMPGLAAMLIRDEARVRLWPVQLSSQGFMAAARRHLRFPPKRGKFATWVLVLGRVFDNERPIALAFALAADQAHTLGPITIPQPHSWMEVLRIQEQ